MKKIKRNEFDDNMDELEAISKNLKGIKFRKRIHPGLVADSYTTTTKECKCDPEALYQWMLKQFGHCIMGHWQFLYEKGDKRIFCIKGEVSFGFYEIYPAEGGDIERFESAEETLKAIKKLLC